MALLVRLRRARGAEVSRNKAVVAVMAQAQAMTGCPTPPTDLQTTTHGKAIC